MVFTLVLDHVDQFVGDHELSLLGGTGVLTPEALDIVGTDVTTPPRVAEDVVDEVEVGDEFLDLVVVAADRHPLENGTDLPHPGLQTGLREGRRRNAAGAGVFGVAACLGDGALGGG